MSESTLVFGLGYIAMGALFMGLAVPLIRRQIPPNGWYGIRISAANESEEAWYRINHHGGKSLLYMGIATSVAGVVNCFLLPALLHLGVSALVVVLPLIFLVLMLIHVYRYPRS